MNPIRALRRYFESSERSAQMLAEIREGIANLGAARQSLQTLVEIREGVANGADHSGRKLDEISAGVASLANVLDAGLKDRSGSDQAIQLLKEIRVGVANVNDAIVRTSRESRAVGVDIHQALVASRDGARPPPVAAQSPPSAVEGGAPLHRRRKITQANDLAAHLDAFEGLTPYAGAPQVGFFAEWSGVMTDAAFREWTGMDRNRTGGKPVQTRLPSVAEGEPWFEYVSWVDSAREAKGRYVMATLGACYGAQAVGCHRALQMLNPMPCKLVAVEPEPDNLLWIKRHFLNNGINPDDHWLIGSAISDTRAPVFFPVGGPGTGAQNCFSTNEPGAREAYVAALAESDQRDEALRNLLLRNSTGMTKSLTGDGRFNAEIKLVSAVTLEDVLGPFDRVDFVEADIQQSEIIVFPPFMDLLKKKVRRIHVGTHGADVHEELAGLFRRDGWEIVFDYAPNAQFKTPYGDFSTNDGVLTVRNPQL
jgi:hypothetical protein